MALLAGCGSDTVCGDGTVKNGNTCEGSGSGSGSGNDTTCGTGTHLEGTMCVPDAPAAHGAPTITMISPDHAGAAGLVQFTITGTNFAGADVSGLQVAFGGTMLDPTTVLATETEIVGQVPGSLTMNAPVTVTTDKGTATTPFHYDALFAADGVAPNGSAGGDLYIVDPYMSLFADLGPIQDTTGVAMGMAAIAFDANGTLYGVTNPASGNAKLVTINLTGAVATAVGDLVDGTGKAYYASGLKFSNGTLYMMGFPSGAASIALMSVNTTTGVATVVGTPTAKSVYGGAFTMDGSGVAYVANDGAGADTMLGTAGELDTANMTTGALTSAGTLDYYGAPIMAMSFLGTQLVAAIDDTAYPLANTSGVTIALIDMSATTKVSPLFEAPAQTAFASHVDALDFAPTTVTIARGGHTASWTKLGAAVNRRR
jgi:hypothetical protein